MSDHEVLKWALEALARVKSAIKLERPFPFFWSQALGGAVAGLQRGQPGALQILHACRVAWDLFPPSERAAFLAIPIPGTPPRPSVPDTLPASIEEVMP